MAERLLSTENTNHRGKYHRKVDFLFDWFGFDQTSKTVNGRGPGLVVMVGDSCS